MSNHPLGVVKESISSRFELVAPLADAGLGEPWSAVDLSANRRPVMVKLLPARPASEPWAFVVARLQSLGNPRLPKVIDGAVTWGPYQKHCRKNRGCTVYARRHFFRS